MNKPLGTDRIFWAPLDARGTILKPYFPWPVHLCPTACTVAPVTREMLDPMALGTCRYCHEDMPA